MTNKDILIPKHSGVHSKQAHADFPEQGIYEREIGRSGFFGPSSHLHHRHAPTGWSQWQGPLRPRAFNLNKLESKDSSPWLAPTVLKNSACHLRFWRLIKSMPFLVSNGDGDDLLFIHEGKGTLFCDFGRLSVEAGDYLLLPRGMLWRLEIDAAMTVLMIEATGAQYRLPDRGILGRHAIFDPSVLECPEIDAVFLGQQNESPWDVHIKRGDQWATVSYPFNPLDAIGWHGDLYPVKLSCRDIRPIMSHRYHVPPSVHSTFVAPRFVVCTFVPRPIETDPGALKVPFYHSNTDYDEVLFYHSGNFFSRDNIEPGMITFHPCGFPHGPHPKAFKKAQSKDHATETNEVAVMIDSQDGFNVSEASEAVEFEGYVDSWQTPA